MTDSEFTMFVFLWIFGGIILVQWWRLHRYRKKIEKIAFDGRSAPAPFTNQLVEPVGQARDEELDRIKRRLQVLERIATDSSTRLESELEDLRRA